MEKVNSIDEIQEPLVNKLDDSFDDDKASVFTIKSILDYINNSNNGINTAESVFIMISLSFGSAVIILPYTVGQLGWITWLLFVLVIMLSLGICVELLHRCSKIMISKFEGEVPNDCYPELAEMAGGPILKTLSRIGVYAYGFLSALTFFLLAATVLNDAIPIWGLSIYGQIRCWTVIAISISFPMLCLGNISDLKSTAGVAVLTSSIAMVSIIIDSLLIRHQGVINTSITTHPQKHKSIFSVFGFICFAAAGAGYVFPNMYVFVKNKEKCSYAIFASYFISFLIYTLAGLIPYFVFGVHAKPSITSTIALYLKEVKYNSTIKVFVTIAQLCMAIHFVLVAVIVLNPIFQSAERYLKLPQVFSWKRLLVRLGITILMTAICLSVPNFQPVLSLVGGVPITFLCILFPIIIYWRLHDLTFSTKLVLVIVFLTFLILLIGNFIYGVIDIYVVIHAASR